MGTAKNYTVKNPPRDWTVYKVCVAFVLMVLSILAARHIIDIYGTASTFDVVYYASRRCALLCLVLCAASVVGYVLLREKPVRCVFPYVFTLAALAGLCALDLRYFWIEHATAIYMAHAAVYGLYMVFCLYRSEFFCFSLATVLAGFCFYFYSKGFGPNARTVFLAALLVLVLTAIALLASLAAKGKGAVRLFGKTRRIFFSRFNPTVLYVTCAVLACCLVVSLVIGPAFAYYCMFAAVAMELIGAVYYTFQLK